MRRELPGGYELDDALDRVDVDAVHDFIANHSYWAPGRSREVMDEFIRLAHKLYEKFGFGPPSERVMERPRRKGAA